MGEGYQDRLQQAIVELGRTPTNLLDAYILRIDASLLRIKGSYQKLTPTQKDTLLERLDDVVQRLESGSLITKKTPHYYSTRKNILYDSEKARNIRKEVGLTQRELAAELGLGRHGHIRISHYEIGAIKPSNPPRGEVSKRYTKWLKEHGYNPFNL